MRLALDTNVLAYAEGVNGSAMQKLALELIDNLPDGSTFVPVQVLGELFNLLVRKAGRSRSKVRTAVLSWRDVFPLIETSAGVLFSAIDLANTHQFGIWDSVILSATSDAGCQLLLSEDMQDGFTWRGVTIANPFSKTRNPLLSALLRRNP